MLATYDTSIADLTAVEFIVIVYSALQIARAVVELAENYDVEKHLSIQFY